MNSEIDVRAAIISAINKVRHDSGRGKISPQDDDLLAGEIGLDSLDLAVLVVTLEQQLGVDPFREGSQTARTLGELISVYAEAKKS